MSYLVADGVFTSTPTDEQLQTLLLAVPHVQERMETLRQGVGMLGFLFFGDDNAPLFEVDPHEADKVLTDEAKPVLSAALSALEQLTDWTTESIEEALRRALIEGLDLKPKSAFGPVRVAVTGRRVSPPLFESLEILGRERALSRIKSALA